MLAYVLKRLFWTIVVLWVVLTATFAATYLSPINPAVSFSGPHPTRAQIAQTRNDLGLDRPLYVQYGLYVSHVARGNLGVSFEFGGSVSQAIFERLPRTGVLALAAIFVQLVVGIPLGILGALRRGGVLDRSVLAFSLMGVATPSFVLGFVLLYFFAFRLSWFPLGGYGSVSDLVLPAMTIGLAGAAWYARMLRSTTLNILGEDFVKMARAKGLRERLVIFRHVLRNSVTPIVAMAGLDLGTLFGGVLVIEKVFGYPGIGEQAWTAVQSNDIPMVMGTVLVAAFFITILNLVADLLNAWLDPRVKLA